LFDSEYELSKAGYTANEVNDGTGVSKAEERDHFTGQVVEYAKPRAIAKDKKWFRHPGIDVRGSERRDDPSGLTCGALYLRSGGSVARFKGAAAGNFSACSIRVKVSSECAYDQADHGSSGPPGLHS